MYSRENGSAAAPTAGLHFTNELLEKIKAMGAEEVFVTLHVGLGTFRPVSVEDINDHVMHREFYSVSPQAAAAINKAKAEGRRIVAVGTTAVRTLEAAGESGEMKAGGNWTKIFIYPGLPLPPGRRFGDQFPSAAEHAFDAGIGAFDSRDNAGDLRRGCA